MPSRTSPGRQKECAVRRPTIRGVVAWVRIASLIQTARLNGVEPYVWLKDTLEAFAAGHPNNRLDDLLPWNFTSSSS